MSWGPEGLRQPSPDALCSPTADTDKRPKTLDDHRLQPSFGVALKNYLHELYTAFFNGKIVFLYNNI